MKKEPCNKATTEKIVQQYPTPFHIYDESGYAKCKGFEGGLFLETKGIKSTLL